MEKTKLKKTRTMHLENPASYYQSWTPEPPRYKYHARNTDSTRTFYDSRTQRFYERQYHSNRGSNMFRGTKREIDSRVWSQALVRTPDPSAPHLKYGMFANRTASNRLPYGAKRASTKSHYTIPQASYHSRQPSQEMRRPKHPRKKQHHKKTTITESLCVYGNAALTHSRHLSLSEIMHIDIKPKKKEYHHSAPAVVPNYERRLAKLASTSSLSPR